MNEEEEIDDLDDDPEESPDVIAERNRAAGHVNSAMLLVDATRRKALARGDEASMGSAKTFQGILLLLTTIKRNIELGT